MNYLGPYIDEAQAVWKILEKKGKVAKEGGRRYYKL